MALEIMLTISIVFLIISIYVNYNLNKKLEESEDYINDLENSNLNFYTWFNNFKTKIGNSQSKIKQVDRIGSFESDDETGFIFKTLKDVINDLNKEF